MIPFEKGIGIGDSDWIATCYMLPSPSCIRELTGQEIKNGVKTGQESRLDDFLYDSRNMISYFKN